ncbi:MAG: type II toxin-antitoxin system RelE/ParE family toxin [Chloroflexi bacterium]|nr:type II toxin-antitoxin system RelE/ParE family toxin [Chloroflexota bacterium]
MISALRNLENDPRPRISISLQGNIYRLRLGRLRIIYLIEESNRTIVVGAVRRRSETTYRDIRRLF